MRQVQTSRWGGLDVLHTVSVPVPQPGPGQVVVKAASIGLNPVEWKTRAGGGIAGMLDAEHPVVLGWDLAGTVEATGPDATGFVIGEAVFGMPNFPGLGNTYADYVVVSARDVQHAPKNVPLDELGATPLVALTAWQALFDVAGLERGESVLVHAGAGGVGHWAVQLAVHAGATVYATAGPDNQEFLRELGAIAIDYTAGDFRDAVPAVDLVIDTIGGDTFIRSLDVVAPGGRIVAVPSPENLPLAVERGITAHWVLVRPDRDQLREIAVLLDSGAVRTVIDRRFTLDEMAQAHAYGESGHVRGKIVVVPGRPT